MSNLISGPLLRNIFLGQDNTRKTVTETGTVAVPGALTVRGKLTLAGAGTIILQSEGASIVSDGLAGSTLMNSVTIDVTADATIGDRAAGLSRNALALDNTGKIDVSGEGVTLIVDTGAQTIVNSGIFEAEQGGHLILDSNMQTGIVAPKSRPTHLLLGGQIIAGSGGWVTLAADVADGIAPTTPSIPGRIVIAGGTVELDASSSVEIPIAFSGSGGALVVHGAGKMLAAPLSLAAGASIEVDGTRVQGLTLDPGAFSVTTDAGQFNFTQADFMGTVSGIMASADPSTGLASVSLLEGAGENLAASNADVLLNGGHVRLNGGDDAVTFAAQGGGRVDFSNGDDAWNSVSGEGIAVTLTNSSATVTGGGNVIALFTGAGTEVSLFDTASGADQLGAYGATIDFNSVQASVQGGGNVLNLNGDDNIAELSGTDGVADIVNGAGATITLDDAQASVFGGGDTITLLGADASASLSRTDGVTDMVFASHASLTLTDAQITLNGGAQASAASGADLIALNALFGQTVVSGYDSSDTIQFACADFADWRAVQGAMSQSGADTVITLDSANSLRLTNMDAGSLTANDFRFA